MLGATGRTCTVAGRYESVDGCMQRITLRENEMFPPCPGCGRTVSWRRDKRDKNAGARNDPPPR
jgi:predicted RNA-binding Zn-ribbon protein involved in translation (DUF1610 family)